MRVDVLDAPKPVFVIHRFITDAIGRVFGSYAAYTVIYAIDNTSHTPSEFDHLSAVGFAASLIVADYVIAKQLGNKKSFGLMALTLASLFGFFIFSLKSLQIYFAAQGTLTTPLGDIIIG